MNKKISNLSVCIWGDGPGRPYDNIYQLLNIDYKMEDKVIHLSFSDGEECIIEEPSGVVLDDKHLRIDSAKKITWKFYYYGKPQSPETLILTNYYLLDKKRVRVVVEGDGFNRDEVINVSKAIAFTSI